MKKIAMCIFCTLLSTGAAQAVTVKDLAACSAKSDSVERLNCFDELAKAEKADQPATVSTSKGEWDVTSETSKINDKTNVYLHVQSKDSVSQRFGGEQKADLWITCREEQTSIFLTFGNLFLADNGSYGDVTLRIDKQKARVISMNESTNNQALGLWRGTGGKLIKSMFGATSLFVQVTPFNESAVTAEFNIAELEQAIAPLRKACKW